MSPTTHAEQQELRLPPVLYDERFLSNHVGRAILNDPTIAIIELIANCWDAAATEVDITWPDAEHRQLAIIDNGIGMTHNEFFRRWRTLSYNRFTDFEPTIKFPPDMQIEGVTRYAFGKNGIGRWASFCFGKAVYVKTWKDGKLNKYRVERGSAEPFLITHEAADESHAGHGTAITVADANPHCYSPDSIRNEIGLRFLTDPNFVVRVNGAQVTFEDISDPHIKTLQLNLADGHTIQLIVIDTHSTDRTSSHKGVAWHVHGRLVGSCSWSNLGRWGEDFIDRRRVAAKRFTFIVRADHLAEENAINCDWSGFDENNEAFQVASKAVFDKVNDYLSAASDADRLETLETAKKHNRSRLREMTPLKREAWTRFVTEAQEKCPSLKESDLVKLSEIMANLAHSKSGFDLLQKLGQYGPDQLDELHQVLEDWTLDMVKIVLDEIARRLKLIEELQLRVADEATREVQDLQPLFERGLWIFGPEFETIEYTSNKGMARVVQDLFQKQIAASKNRPDFAILPDGSAGLYGYPEYDEEGGEIGTAKLVVVELKKPGTRLGEKEKGQCWKYVKELFQHGMLQEGRTKVRCFVLGSQIERLEGDDRKELNDSVVITPMVFETILARAKGRMLKLHAKVQDAPFLDKHRDEINRFLEPMEFEPELFDQTSSA